MIIGHNTKRKYDQQTVELLNGFTLMAYCPWISVAVGHQQRIVMGSNVVKIGGQSILQYATWKQDNRGALVYGHYFDTYVEALSSFHSRTISLIKTR